MDFDALQLVWDSQTQRPLYAVNEEALHQSIRRQHEEFCRRSARWQVREMATGSGFSLLMLGLAGVLALGDPAWLATRSWIRVPVSHWDVAALLVSGIWVHYGAYMLRARHCQLRREEAFASTIRGDLDRAVGHVEFQIRTARGIVWWGFVPAWLAMVLWMAVMLHLKGVRGLEYPVLAGGRS